MAARPVRIAVFCSGSASSMRYLIENDPNYGRTYVFVGLFSDKKGASGIEYAERHNIQTYFLDYQRWCRRYGVNQRDLKQREAYYDAVLHGTVSWDIEGIMLSGFMLLITNPLLTRFAGKILNVHPALLSLTEDGKRKYTGLSVVTRAMRAGDPTGSTVHIVTAEPDMGPIIVESAPLPYKTGDDPAAHQELMKTMCDAPAYQTAFKLLIWNGWPRVLL